MKKYIPLAVIVSCLIFVVTITFTSHASHAFAQTVTSTSTAPMISSVDASSTNSTTGTITWTTDMPATTKVVYGTSTLYGATTTEDTSLVTNHSQMLFGLTPGTQYNYYVYSANASGTAATSSNMTFMTLADTSSSTPATSTAPIISNVGVSTTPTTATITWMTDQTAHSYISYGLTSNYGTSTTLTSSLLMSHSLMLSDLTSNTQYHYRIFVENASGTQATSSDYTFMTGSSTSTSTDPIIQTLQNQIQDLLNRVKALEDKVASLLGGGGGGGTTTPPTTGTATLMPMNITLSPGGHIDFNGRNFGHEENVTIMRDGSSVGTAHADGGGNFSTGSLSAPMETGTYTYSFTGVQSGTSLSATVMVQ
jgi:hypothetical protein